VAAAHRCESGTQFPEVNLIDNMIDRIRVERFIRRSIVRSGGIRVES
jgi:hypothetical protein